VNSLRSRLLLLFLVAFVPIIAITVHEPLNERKSRLEQAEQETGRRVEQAASAQRELLSDSRHYLRAVALLPQLSTGDSVVCGRLLALFRRIIDEGWSVSRVQPDGTVDCMSNPQEADSVDEFVPRNRAALSVGDTGIVGPYRMSSGKDGPREAVVMTYVALRDSIGTFRGALVMRSKMRWLADLAREVGRDSQAVVRLLDSTGFVFAQFPDPTHIAGTTPQVVVDGKAQPMQLLRGMQYGAAPNHVERLFAYQQLPGDAPAPVYLNVGVSARPILDAANAALFRSVAWLCLWITLTILGAWWAAERGLLRDVRALTAATEKLGQGDLSARTGLESHAGELGQLAKAFDDMAQQLQMRQDRLAQAQKMESVGQLAGGVAHDFNNLLTAIIGNAEMAREQLPANHAAREELRHVLDAARRSSKLTRQLLAFARRHTMDVHVLSLNVLLNDVTSLLQRLIGEHIALTVDSDANLQPTNIDPTQFEQLIMNLAVNARDAMPQGGALRIAVHNAQVVTGDADSANGVPAGSWVALTVTDTGTGMSADVIRRAFEPFYTTKGVGEGTGLGLAVVYGTVQQHAGHVRILSVLGSGTTVRILLPPSSAKVEVARAPVLAPAPSVRGSETVLLVEDEPAVRAVSARLLRNHGYIVREAIDGTDALQQMENGTLDSIALLVTDVVMPRMGGPELATTLRKDRPTLPVLLVSGYSEAGIPDSLMQTPGTLFVEKPFSTDALLSAVRRLLDER
jgi:signal transduction histidine kinase/ActR/RegA family two-component response regulator